MLNDNDMLRASTEGKGRLQQAKRETKRKDEKDITKEKVITYGQIAREALVHEDQVKRLFDVKGDTNRVRRDEITRIAAVLSLQVTDIVDAEEWYNRQLPLEFEPIIREKTWRFYGRRFVFEEIESFLKNNPCGYFTVVGSPGMGKSAIAAKYVADNYAICYFNILAESRNRPELFIQSVSKQLISRYHLENPEGANLSTLLAEVSRKLSSSERLVIVVDALDEVKQESRDNENILHLPIALPDKVYFLLTRRSYNLNTKRLTVSPGVPEKELDLTKSYVVSSREDMEGYLRLSLNENPNLRRWIQKHNYTSDYFVEQLAIKSKNNFMYVKLFLIDFARGLYNDLTLKQLPEGLQNYYQTHWVRMRMNDALNEMKVRILFTLVESSTPITCKLIAKFVKQDEYDVELILDEWVGYLEKQKIENQICHSIYHTSFLNFLNEKKDLDSNRKLLQDVNESMARYLY